MSDSVVGRIVGVLGIDDGKFKAGMANAKKDFASTGKEMEGWRASAAVAGGAMIAAGTGMAVALKGATNEAKDFGSQAIMLQRMTGMNAEESSKWAAILGRFGVEGKKAGLVFKSLSVEIASGGQNLAKLGIETRNADGSLRATTDVLADLAEKYKNSKDKTEVLAVATKTLGRGFTDLLPILAGGKAAIADYAQQAQDSGLILSQSDLNAIKAYNGALKENEQAMKGMTIQVGLATLPMETFKAKTLGGLLKTLRDINPELPKLAGGIGSVAAPSLQVAGGLTVLVAMLPSLQKGFGIVTQMFPALGNGGAIAGAGLVGLMASLGALEGTLVNSGMAAAKFPPALQLLVQAAIPAAGVMKANEVVTKAWGDAWNWVTGAMKGSAAAAPSAAAGFTGIDNSVNKLSQDVTNLYTTWTRQHNAEESSLEAKINLKQAHKDLSTAIKTYGKNSDEAKLAALRLKDAELQARDAARKAREEARKKITTPGLSALEQQYSDLADAAERAAKKMRDANTVNNPGRRTSGVGMARGGIADGPKSGYPMTLHGREAVLPLDDPARTMQVLAEAGIGGGSSEGGRASAFGGGPTVNVFADSMADVARIRAEVYAALSDVTRDSRSMRSAYA